LPFYLWAWGLKRSKQVVIHRKQEGDKDKDVLGRENDNYLGTKFECWNDNLKRKKVVAICLVQTDHQIEPHEVT
jgi:hypothetical protein